MQNIPGLSLKKSISVDEVGQLERRKIEMPKILLNSETLAKHDELMEFKQEQNSAWSPPGVRR